MVVPTMQCQMAIPSNSIKAKPIMTPRMWNSLLLHPQRPRTKKSSNSTFKVLAVKSENDGVVSRLEGLLNMDITPYTDKIIAEYIWYVTAPLPFSLNSLKSWQEIVKKSLKTAITQDVPVKDHKIAKAIK